VDVLRDGAQSVLGEQMRAGESTAPIHAPGAPCAIACASVLSPEPHRSELADPGWCEEPCGDLGGASAQLAVNLLCIVAAVVVAVRLEPFMEPSGSERTLQSVGNGRIRGRLVE
jgi:hypothetical protein